jgi:hypothetical protein
MYIQVAVICDAATETYGKLSLLGAFDTILAQQLPWTHPQCSIALRMTFNQSEEGSHKLWLNLVDEDGQPVMPGIPLTLEIKLPEDNHFVTCNFIVGIQQLKFERPGHYSIDIALDGRREDSIPLLVKYIPPKTPGVND